VGIHHQQVHRVGAHVEHPESHTQTLPCRQPEMPGYAEAVAFDGDSYRFDPNPRRLAS
jgi:hypothetical protein